MIKTINLPFRNNKLLPTKQQVLATMGMDSSTPVPPEVEDLFEQGIEEFKSLSDPIGFYKPIAKKELEDIYEGKGQNEMETPIKLIYKRSEGLALFICTLGENVSSRIELLMKDKDYPLGYMLDRIASESAELVVEKAELHFAEHTNSEKALLYSPGYCGWHITAQEKIFKFLKPETIGVTINESSLMSPIKSVSGILMAGSKSIHNFKNNYKFCKSCQNFACRERIKR
jgi:hypothetical protein